MSEFSSFAAFADHLKNGGDFKILAKKGAAFKRALNNAGEELVDYYKSRFDQSGPGWPDLSPLTHEWRERYAGYGNPAGGPLDFSGQLRESIGHAVEGQELHIGVKAGYHVGPTGRTMELGELMEIHENGYGHVPPRPVFGDSQGDAAIHQVADNFVAHVLANRIISKRAFKSKSKKG